MTDRNCLTYWWPKLVAANIPTPKTEIVDAGPDGQWPKMVGFMDSPKQHPASYATATEIIGDVTRGILKAADKVGGYPVFLRTGQGSGKHRWKECCDLQRPADIESHICALIEWSEMVDMMGLPYRYWCVRERLPVKPIAVLPGYGDMPLVREMRCFVEGGKILCHHAYWPRDAVRDGLAKNYDLDVDNPQADARELEADSLYAASLMDMEAEHEALRLAKEVAKVFADDGFWSVDVLQTERGMFITDMAIGEHSFHWEGCSTPEGRKVTEAKP